MAHRKLTLKPIPTNLFSFKDKLFTAEISDLRGYEVASEIVLTNPKTNGQAKFTLVNVDRDVEGETVGWRYNGVQHPDVRVLIIND